MIFQVKEAYQHWRLSKWDGILWILTFLVTLFVQIDVGLAVGIVTSIIIVAAQGLKPRVIIMGRLAGTDLYLDIKRHKAVGIIMFCKIYLI